VSTKAINLAVLAFLASAAPAMAQTAPANNIDDRVRSQTRVLTDKDREEAMLTGDTDIVLHRSASAWARGSAERWIFSPVWVSLVCVISINMR
jgi:hypothetical protein